MEYELNHLNNYIDKSVKPCLIKPGNGVEGPTINLFGVLKVAFLTNPSTVEFELTNGTVEKWTCKDDLTVHHIKDWFDDNVIQTVPID